MTVITDEEMDQLRATMKPYTVVLLQVTGRIIGDDIESTLREHRRRNLELRADGVLSIVCPIPNSHGWAAVYIFDAPPDEVRRLMDADPAVEEAIFSYEIHEGRSFAGRRPARLSAGPLSALRYIRSIIEHCGVVSQFESRGVRWS